MDEKAPVFLFDDVRVGDIRFPDYADRFGWRPVGARTDEVAGRQAVTVIYRKGGQGVHYTVVDGKPLELNGPAQHMRDGTPAWVVRDGHTRAVGLAAREDRSKERGNRNRRHE